MKSLNGAASLLVISLATGVSGCMENIALIGRPSIAEDDIDIAGEIERIDLPSRRVYLRPERGKAEVIAFSTDARVLDRGREYSVSRLERGDIVAMQVRRDSRGDSYTDLIRVQNRVVDRGRDTLTESAPQILTLSGTVERVDPRSQSFDLNDQPGKPLFVVLSANARDSDRERFLTLRAGDYVRIEGQFVSQDRFELISFLNAES
jgi:hypothetical protein